MMAEQIGIPSVLILGQKKQVDFIIKNIVLLLTSYYAASCSWGDLALCENFASLDDLIVD